MSCYFDQGEFANALKNAYRQFPAKESTLDIDFINNRQRVAGVQGAALDGVTFTRSTTGTYFDANGTLQTAAINAPRFEYDPVSLRPLGLLIEESRANLLLNSDTGVTQSVTVTAVAHTLSFWGTGTVTLSGVSTAGPLVGTGANSRVTLTFTPTAGTLTLTVSGTVTKWQLEAGGFATSYISTGGTAATRGADLASMTGANFSGWYNSAEGCFLVEFDSVGPLLDNRIVLAVSNNTFNNSIYIIASNNLLGSQTSLSTIVGGVSQGTISSGVYSSYTRRRSSVGMQLNNAAITSDGRPLTIDTTYNLPTVDRMYIGADYSGGSGNILCGHMSRLTYCPKRLPNNLPPYISRLTA